MTVHRLIAAALLMTVIGACGATGPRSPQAEALESGHESVPSRAAEPTPSVAPTPRATPRPTPTLPPVPAKPAGVTFEAPNESIEGPPGDTAGIGDFIVTVTWKKPRTKGAEIRVYGVTKCFEKADDNYCLRRHTRVPAAVRVLLAKAPASKGTVTFRLPLGDDGGWSKDGRRIHSFVIAAYNESGQSTFQIAEPGNVCSSNEQRCDTY